MPAYCRMVHSRPRYMVACTPRVKGYSPGYPTSHSWSQPLRSAEVYNECTGICEEVSGSEESAADLERVGGLSFSVIRISTTRTGSFLRVPSCTFVSFVVSPVSSGAHARTSSVQNNQRSSKNKRLLPTARAQLF